LALDNDFTWALECRSESYRQMGRFVEALDDMNRVKAL